MRRVRLTALLLLLATACSLAPKGEKMLRPGDPFPSWSLRDHTGTPVSDRDLAGHPYLLWFFPKAMTSGCTTEGRQLRDRFEDFKKQGVDVLGVSFDTPEMNAEFVKTEGFPFRLLSDQDHTLAVAVGAARSSNQLFAARISYLVGADGRVQRAYAEVTPAEHAGQVLGDLQSPAGGG